MFGVVALIGTSTRSTAAPITYSFNDLAARSYAGSGVFTLNVGAPLGEYHATGVAGSGDAFGTWGAASFLATPGSFAMLVISNLVGASVTISLSGIGGSDIQAGSLADDEWRHFIDQASKLTNPIRIVAISTPVPDSGPSLVWSALTLAGVSAWARGGRGRVERSGRRLAGADSAPLTSPVVVSNGSCRT